jgi:DNA (cytosine-5)-methyltransferase 1
MDDNFIEEPLINYDCRLREAKNTKWNHISPTLGAHNYAMPHFVREPKCIQVASLEGKGFNEMTARVYGGEGLSPTIQTMGGGNHEPKIAEPISVAQRTLQDRIYSTDGTSTAITQAFMPSIAIPEATKMGFALAQDGDGVYINRPHQKRGVVQRGKIQALKTSGNDVGVVVATNLKAKMCDELIANGKVRAYDVIRHSYTNSRMEGKMNDIQENNMSPTIDTRADCLGVVTQELRIRKLTPRECWRLTGIDDSDFDKAQEVCSNSQLYKQAGNGIVVDVFAAILRNLIEVI